MRFNDRIENREEGMNSGSMLPRNNWGKEYRAMDPNEPKSGSKDRKSFDR